MDSTDTAECPPAETLSAFASGQLGDDDLARVAEHVERCPTCMAALVEPPAGDPFVEQLQRIHQEVVQPWTAVAFPSEDAVAESGPYFYNISRQPPTQDAESFFEALQNSGLANENETDLARLEWKAFRSADLEEFAHSLVAGGRLTDFQARQLLRGKHRGWLLGEYVIMHPIGAGGMGLVYRAYHRRLKRNVALKITPPHLTRSASAVKRFQREIEAVGKLRHPRLVSALDAGEIDGVNFLVMEELEGHSLAEWVELNGPMRVLTSVDMIRQAAEGLAVAHESGVIHRDVKPSNLWIETFSPSRSSRSQPGLKVLDFGLAHMTNPGPGEARNHNLTASQITMGTLGYMAPEQARDSRSADERADIFSLGCTLYFLLSGKGPFDGASALDSFAKQLEQTPPPLASPHEPIPDALQTIYQRMVAKSPGDRYSTMDELIVDLDAFLAGSQIAVRWPRWVKRTAVAGVGTVTALGLWLVVRAVMPAGSIETPRPILSSGPRPAPCKGSMSPNAAAVAQKAWSEALGTPVDKTLAGVRLRLIPPGTIRMGSPDGQIDERLRLLPPGGWQQKWLRSKGVTEWPAHEVTITRPFYLGATEVTVKQFSDFVHDSGYVTEAEDDGLGGVSYSKGLFRRQNPSLTWRAPGFTESAESYPVVQITPRDVDAYCRWLSKKEKQTVRLPTEAEWEYACRAGSEERWFWGRDADAASDFISMPANGRYGPGAVARRRPNAFGLYDMSGNVAELVADRYVETDRPNQPRTDPKGPTGESDRVLRGGAFLHPLPDAGACAARLPAPDTRQDFAGFRILVEIPLER